MNTKSMIIILAVILISTTSFSASSITAGDTTKNGWRQLFNGKDLTGWTHVGDGS